jgi:hypothetical protein
VETCFESIESMGERRDAADAAHTLERWDDLRGRIAELRDSVDSEWSAASQALTGRGMTPVRKWLGWALYRVAARLNPEIRD